MRIAALDLDERVVVIAEIGNNHEGDPDVARELVERAADAGADAVKLQTFRTEHYVSAADEQRFARLKSFELPFDVFCELAELARARGLAFLSTPFDLESARFLGTIADALKVSSGDNDFFPLLRRVAEAGKPVIVSTGLAGVPELRRAVETVRGAWSGDDPGLALLHCVSAYPVPPEEANLRGIEALGEAFDCTIGYSDHTVGLDAAPLAVALGARIIEKHFTLDKQFSDFRDHQLSADPEDLRVLVGRIRTAESMLGRPEKSVQPSEQDGSTALRRSIVAAADLPAGHTIAASDLTWVRPGGGLAPGEEERLVGRTLVRDVRAGEQLAAPDIA